MVPELSLDRNVPTDVLCHLKFQVRVLLLDCEVLPQEGGVLLSEACDLNLHGAVVMGVSTFLVRLGVSDTFFRGRGTLKHFGMRGHLFLVVFQFYFVLQFLFLDRVVILF